MRNLIIIGNGFDKAHNMKTGYDDFIENLFGKFFENNNNCPDILKNFIVCLNGMIIRISLIILLHIQKQCLEINSYLCKTYTHHEQNPTI